MSQNEKCWLPWSVRDKTMWIFFFRTAVRACRLNIVSLYSSLTFQPSRTVSVWAFPSSVK